MPTTKQSEKRDKHARTETAIPKVNNRIYGDDVPMPWREAAVEGGFKERTLWRHIERREVTIVKIGGKVRIRPSALRELVKRQEVQAV